MIQAPFCVLARLFIWKFASFLDITRLWLTAIELMELNAILIVGVLFSFYSLPTVKVDNKLTKNVKDPMFYASYQSWHSCPLLELVAVAFRATKNLEEFVLSISYQSYQLEPSELPKTWNMLCCRQLLELTTVVLWATKILTIVRVDMFVHRTCQSYQKPGRLYTYRQLFEMKTETFRAMKSFQLSALTFLANITFRATKIRVAIHVNHRFQSY